MEQFTNSIRQAVEDKNWFSALFLALCMPDICATIETPENTNVGDRYRRWFNENLASKYEQFFSADDCYAFRCSCLHQGLDTHTNLNHDRIHFIVPPPNGNIVHLNKFNEILQMQVNIFCNDVAIAVDSWNERVVTTDETLQIRVNGLIKIHTLETFNNFITFE